MNESSFIGELAHSTLTSQPTRNNTVPRRRVENVQPSGQPIRNRAGASSPTDRRKCYYCRANGHLQAQCRKRLDDLIKERRGEMQRPGRKWSGAQRSTVATLAEAEEDIDVNDIPEDMIAAILDEEEEKEVQSKDHSCIAALNSTWEEDTEEQDFPWGQ